MNPDENNDLYKPGESVSPSSASSQPPEEPAETPDEAKSAAPDTEEEPVAENDPQPSQPSFSWSALEFIDHSRGSSWYAVLIVGTILLAAIVYFLTRDYFAVGTIIVVGVIAGIFATRKPRELQYELNQTGVSIGDKHYSYGLFKSFAIFQEGQHHSINLLPIKRFMPPLSLYFEPADEEKVAAVLGDHLPFEERQPDSIDRLSHRLRF